MRTASSARKDLIHSQIVDMCKDHIHNIGFFSKEEILKKLQISSMHASIRWDFVRTILQEDLGEELVAMGVSFFNAIKDDRLTELKGGALGRCLAGGHGGKTHGYASVTFNEGVFGLLHAQMLDKVGNGVQRVQDRTVETMIRRDQQAIPDETKAEAAKYHSDPKRATSH